VADVSERGINIMYQYCIMWVKCLNRARHFTHNTVAMYLVFFGTFLTHNTVAMYIPLDDIRLDTSAWRRTPAINTLYVMASFQCGTYGRYRLKADGAITWNHIREKT